MGKLKTPPNVDLRNFTIEKSLQQIRKSNFSKTDHESPCLVEVWACDIGPQETKPFLKFIEETIRTIDLTDLNHIKRLRKREGVSPVMIEAIVCSTSLVASKELLISFLHEHSFDQINPDTFHILSIPGELPLSKERANIWSREFWPVSWRGNPNHQDLITASFDILQERFIINTLMNSVPSSHQYPTRTIVAKEDKLTGKLEILYIAHDLREIHPLHHSVMVAIDMVAKDEKKKRKQNENEELGYLCHNLLFYTTHEPCTMCAMALVHSRIGRLTYIHEHPGGGIQSSYFIGDRRDLNWTFDIWKWVGDLPPDEEVTNIDNVSP